jgi:hypothetical protein
MALGRDADVIRPSYQPPAGGSDAPAQCRHARFRWTPAGIL